ncbi:MAG: hypothetical protein AAGG07_01270 [Planctomycetota bacterium]
MKSTLTLIALAGITGTANAQLIDIRLDGEKWLIPVSETDISSVSLSIWLDRESATDGFFADFAGGSTCGGIRPTDGRPAGAFIGGTESATEVTGSNPFAPDGPNTWTLGRRPGGVAGLNNGSFRYPNASTNVFSYEGGSTMEFAGGGNFEGFQAGPSLGNNFPDTADRIEVFRATIDFSGIAAGIYDVDFIASSLAIGFGDLDTARPIVDLATVSGARFGIPTPGTAALLSLAGLAAARRRR